MGLYTIDFETTTDPTDCRVWAWGVSDIDNPDFFQYGNSIDTFFEFVEGLNENSTLFAHNLKFEGAFIFNYLFRHGFEHIRPVKQKRGEKFEWSTKGLEKSRSFTTLISDMGQFYCTKIIFAKSEKKTKYCKIIDSYKILPYSVNDIAKGFGLPINKLKLDYTTYRAPGHELTPHEVAYQKNDVVIMAMALGSMRDQGLTKMTQGANALADYKNMRGRLFRYSFPVLDERIDTDIRKAYKGGFTYLKPEYKEKDLGNMLVLDVNSLYPWAMRECLLPVGRPRFFTGEYQPDPDYPLYVQCLTCAFELKPGKIPTIQIKGKGHFKFAPTEYLTSSQNQAVTLVLTNVDLELFKENYTLYFPKYHNGWKFRGEHGLFTEYIDKWMKKKIEAAETKNKALRQSSKLMLNSLYGKTATNPKTRSKFPVFDEESGIVRYVLSDDVEEREPVYVPVGAFITAYARRKTITAAGQVYDRFVYADTDSLHIQLTLPEPLNSLDEDELQKLRTEDLRQYGVDIPEDFEIDPYALGAWKIEGKATRARFIRAKCYIEDSNPCSTWDKPVYSAAAVKEFCEEFNLNASAELEKFEGLYNSDAMKITCAGLPANCYGQVTWDNFHEGAVYKGKLQPKSVPGGIVLEQTNFTITKT